MTKKLSDFFYKKITPPDETYFDALGRFVDMFAKAETAIQFVFWHYAKINHDVARALLTGVRSDDVLNRLNRLRQVGQMSDKTFNELKPLLEQYSQINSVRNGILHYGAQAAEDGSRFVSDAFKALTPIDAKVFPISTSLLTDMTYDLRKIAVHLHTGHMGRPSLLAKHEWINELLCKPWRYKPAHSQPKKIKTKKLPKRKNTSP